VRYPLVIKILLIATLVIHLGEGLGIPSHPNTSWEFVSPFGDKLAGVMSENIEVGGLPGYQNMVGLKSISLPHLNYHCSGNDSSIDRPKDGSLL
jgi:hypothetical protein